MRTVKDDHAPCGRGICQICWARLILALFFSLELLLWRKTRLCCFSSTHLIHNHKEAKAKLDWCDLQRDENSDLPHVVAFLESDLPWLSLLQLSYNSFENSTGDSEGPHKARTLKPTVLLFYCSQKPSLFGDKIISILNMTGAIWKLPNDHSFPIESHIQA